MIQMIQMIKRINLRSLTFLLVFAIVPAGSFGALSSVALAGQGNKNQSGATRARHVPLITSQPNHKKESLVPAKVRRLV